MRIGRLTIRTKLLGSSGLLLLLTAGVGLLAIWNLSAVNDRSARMYEDGTVTIADLSEARAALGDMDSQVLRAILREGEGADYAGAVARDVRLLEAEVAEVAEQITAAEERDDLRQLDTAWVAYRAAVDAAFADLDRGTEAGFDAAEARYFAKLAPLYGRIDGLLGELNGDRTEFAAALNEDVGATYRTARTLTVVVVLLAIALGLGLAWFVAAGIVDGVRRLVAATERIGAGDLTADVTEVQGGDEIGQMAAAFQAMTEQLRGLVGTVAATARSLGAASQEMAATSEEAGKAVGEIATAVGEVATGAERQVRMVESTRRSADEVATAVADSAASAQESAAKAVEARAAAGEGVRTAEAASAAMLAVHESTTTMTAAMEQLAAKSEQIGGIVETITRIAGQTNLLALNAAIEAARAGEQGRGFAVVAEEVRKLAEESQQAAATISGLIGEIQHDTENVVSAVEDGARRTAEGAATVEQAKEAFVRIGSSVDDMNQRAEQIAGAAQQIAAGAGRMQQEMDEVAAVAEQSSASVEQVSASTEETSASTQHIAASAQELARTAEELSQLVGRFKVAA
jgi:methyl-accepting chemotaxis protein